jgi:hypothetical protein
MSKEMYKGDRSAETGREWYAVGCNRNGDGGKGTVINRRDPEQRN